MVYRFSSIGKQVSVHLYPLNVPELFSISFSSRKLPMGDNTGKDFTSLVWSFCTGQNHHPCFLTTHLGQSRPSVRCPNGPNYSVGPLVCRSLVTGLRTEEGVLTGKDRCGSNRGEVFQPSLVHRLSWGERDRIIVCLGGYRPVVPVFSGIYNIPVVILTGTDFPSLRVQPDPKRTTLPNM